MNVTILSIQTEYIGKANQLNTSSGNMLPSIIFFSILAVLVILFFYFLRKTDLKVNQQEQMQQLNNEPVQIKIPEEPTDEIAVAIALALSMYKTQMTENDNLTLTIQKVSKMYSPWSSKIYTLRQLPR